MPNSKPSPFNLPNAITVARILLVPLVVALIIGSPNDESWHRWLAVLAFTVSMATDGIDGAIARKKGLITDLGKLLDPIADKALIGGSLIALSLVGPLDWWITIVILLREVGITVYRLVVARRRVLAANRGGKLKTILQAIAVGLWISPIASVPGLEWVWWAQVIILYAALTSTVMSGLAYISAEIRLRRVG